MWRSDEPARERPPAPPAEHLAVLAGATLFLYLIMFRGGLPIYAFGPAEGGIWIDEAHRVLDGEVMYRDFFEFLTPGVVYLNAAVMALCGARISVFCYAAVVLGAALTGLTHTISAKAVGPLWRLLPPIAFAVLVYAPFPPGNHKMPALLFGQLGLLFLMSRAPNPRAGLVAGTFLGLSTLFTADFGLGMTTGAVLYLLVDTKVLRRVCVCLVVAYSATIVLVMSYFLVEAGFSTVFYDCLVFPATYYRQKNVFFLDLFHHRGPRTLAHMVLCAGGIASGLAFLKKRVNPEPARLLAFAGLGLLLLSGHRPITPNQFVVRCAPLLIPLARAMELIGFQHRLLRWANATALSLLAAGFLWGSVGPVARRQWFDPLTKESHRAGEAWMLSPMPEISWIERNTRPGDPVFLFPIKGGLYFLSGTRNATSLPFAIEGQASPEQLRRAATELERVRPGVGVWGSRPGSGILYEAITARYRSEQILNGHVLFRLK